MKLRIAVNKGCFNKENVTDTASGWLNINESLEWLKGWVSSGYGWTATHFIDRYRKSTNARGSNLVVVDIDGDVTIDQFLAAPTVQQWCGAIYTSTSPLNKSTDSVHCFR